MESTKDNTKLSNNLQKDTSRMYEFAIFKEKKDDIL